MLLRLAMIFAVFGWTACTPADVITDWNTLALSAIRAESTPPPLAARNLAILHLAIYDVVNGIASTHARYLATVLAPTNTSQPAAAVAAAHRVLTALYPSQTAVLDEARARSLVGLTNDAALTNGLSLGASVAELILNVRASDGASTTVPYIPSATPGAWRRTLPFDRPQELPQWRHVKPFALKSGDQFRPAGPLPLNSSNYAADVNQVKSFGALHSTNRSAEQTLLARF